MTKDYYKILDIPEFSTTEEIKSAYRKLARRWHPDVAGNTPEVIQMFKDINEAYELLSDNVKKTDYDRARRFYTYGSTRKAEEENRASKTSQGTSKPDFKETYHAKEEKKSGFWEDIFKSRPQRENINSPKKGEDIYSDVEISVFEAVNGAVKTINMLQTQRCSHCGGRKFVNGAKCVFCGGKGETSTYKRFKVTIPQGIKDKSKIRLAGEGEKGINGGKSGDLYLTIHIRETKNYKTDGLNILKTISVSPYEAVLGAEITVPTMIGNVSLKIAPNTKNGQKIRLAGCGIEQNNRIGDMIVTVEIQIPKDLTNAEIELYRKLKELDRKTRERIV